MFAVIKHTFDINKEDKYNSYGETGRYWQYGRESIAIGKVEERIELTTEEDINVKKPIH